MSTLTIVIVNYNTNDFLEGCLESFYSESSPHSYHVIVVDNASENQDFSGIESRYPTLDLILNDLNRGFAFACNQGLRSQTSSFYLLLNPDCVVSAGAIEKCLEFLQLNPEVGVLGCRVNNPDGSLQRACRRRIPKPSTAFHRFSGLSRLFPNSPRFAAYNLGGLPDDKTHEVEAVSGSFLMFRHPVLEDIGGLDEQFFLYGEDLDFCYRASMRGWKVVYYPKAQVTHFKRASSSRNARQSNYHFHRAMELFYRKHFYAEAGRLGRALVLSGIRLLYLCRIAKQKLLGRVEVGSDK
jgi:GT2 family glycosyltransferase